MKAKLTASMLVCSLLQIPAANANTSESNNSLTEDNNSILSAELTSDTDTTQLPTAVDSDDVVEAQPAEPIQETIDTENVQAVEEALEDVVINDETQILDDELAVDVESSDIMTNDNEQSIVGEQENDAILEDTLSELSTEQATDDNVEDEYTELTEEFTDEYSTEYDVSTTDLQDETTVNPNTYNFERPIPNEGDVYIPVLNDAKVFAEFIDSLPAVVNFYTYATEDEVIAFYAENYGEPVEQERKRGRLTVIFYLEDVATRVVISEQDDYRQVDVLQESALL